MSGEERNKLDKLFKKGLDVPDTHFEYSEQDWGDFEQLMDAEKPHRRGIVYWLPALSGVAAVLLLFLGWWLFKPLPVTKQQQQVAVKQLPVKRSTAPTAGTAVNHTNTIITDTNAIHTGAPQNSLAVSATGNKNNGQSSPSYIGVTAAPRRTAIANTIASAQRNTVTNGNAGNNTTNQINSELTADKLNKGALAAIDIEKINPSSMNSLDNEPDIANNMLDGIAAFMAQRTKNELAEAESQMSRQKQKPQLTGRGKGPQFGLAMLVSPDINGVGSFQNSKVGTNIGLTFSVGITKNLTVSTGAAYSKKPYMTDFSNYHTGYQFKTNPEDVYADCRVLDIPINVDYKVYNKSRNSFSVGSGLSSYIMLKENYTYDYAVAGTSGPTGFVVTNKNRHILGVLNLNATYAHQLNAKFSIAAQPYFKIPLTNIGYSQVKLQSAGIAVGLKWNINQ